MEYGRQSREQGLNESGEAVRVLQKALLDLTHPSIKIRDGATGCLFHYQISDTIPFRERISFWR